MSFIKKYCFIVFGLILLSSNISAEIDVDYFYGQASLRSQDGICVNHNLRNKCRQLCGANNYGCLFGVCFCMDDKLSKGKTQKHLSKKEIQMIIGDLERLVEATQIYLTAVEKPEEVEIEHPSLRHHIAHFCPDLEIARQCIYTCMKVGKPAFCGKDHKCYCGHKYSEHDQNKKIDVSDMHAQFRDLYTKYFGPEGGQPAKVAERT